MGDYFEIIKSEEAENSYLATIKLDAAHAIFKGHFPENPVLPGVCQVQILNSTLDKITGKTYFLAAASSLKYIQVINPETNPMLQLEVSFVEKDDFVEVKSVFSFDKIIFSKFSATFKLLD